MAAVEGLWSRQSFIVSTCWALDCYLSGMLDLLNTGQARSPLVAMTAQVV